MSTNTVPYQICKHCKSDNIQPDLDIQELRCLDCGSTDIMTVYRPKPDPNKPVGDPGDRFNLSPVQKKYLDAVSWIFYGPKGVGRSYLCIVAAIKKAMANPNMKVQVFDPGTSSKETAVHLDQVIRNLRIPKLFCHMNTLEIEYKGDKYEYDRY